MYLSGHRHQTRATDNKLLQNRFENKTKLKWSEAKQQRCCRTHLYDNKRVIEVNWGMISCKLLSSNQSSLKWNQTFGSVGTSFIRAMNSTLTKVAHANVVFRVFQGVFQHYLFGCSIYSIHLERTGITKPREVTCRERPFNISHHRRSFVLVSSLPNNFKYNPPNPWRNVATARLYVVWDKYSLSGA